MEPSTTALSNLKDLLPEFLQAIQETFIMLGIGLSASVIFGGLLGTLLYVWSQDELRPNKTLYFLVGGIVNILRSFPFVILMISFGPVARMLTGTTIGAVAASIPLSVAGIAYFTRLVELALKEIPKGVIEASISMGASLKDIILKVLLVEARSTLVLAFTSLCISYLSYTAAAGMIGGGGIGDLAIRYGYYRFQTEVMLATVVGLAVFVQVLQSAGNISARILDKRK